LLMFSIVGLISVWQIKAPLPLVRFVLFVRFGNVGTAH
jgi:hypothetical protein